MKYLAQASTSALGRLVAALPIVAVVVYVFVRLAELVPNFGG